MKVNINRRDFITKTIASGAAVIIGGQLLSGCQSGKDSDGASGDNAEVNSLDVSSCDDLSKVPEAEIKKREGFAYVEESPMPDKHCKNCQLYLPPKEGQSCGGCALFQGPVFEEGYCTYWAPIV